MMFDFEWPVDSRGYEWAQDAGAGWLLRRRGGPNHFYRPLEDNPGLFRRFATLPSLPDREAILDFTNTFGFIDNHPDYEYFLLDNFNRQRECLSIVVSLLDDKGPMRASLAFNALLHPRFRLWMDLKQDPPAMNLLPTTLYGMMMVQLAQEIAGIVKFKKCKQCPEWFQLGKNLATSRREFCSDRCRVAWHRHSRMGGAT